MIVRYRVYYEFNGPTKGDPFRREKNPDHIQEGLDRVELELQVFLNDENAKITSTPEQSNSIILTVETAQSEEVFSQALAKCLRELDLFGSRVS